MHDVIQEEQICAAYCKNKYTCILIVFTLLPYGEYLGHHTDFECGSQVVGQRVQKVQASHAQFDHKPVKLGEKFLRLLKDHNWFCITMVVSPNHCYGEQKCFLSFHQVLPKNIIHILLKGIITFKIWELNFNAVSTCFSTLKMLETTDVGYTVVWQVERSKKVQI